MGFGGGRVVRRDGGTGFGGSAPGVSAWSGGESSKAAGGDEGVDGEGEGGGNGKGKGKGRQGKKVVLMGWG